MFERYLSYAIRLFEKKVGRLFENITLIRQLVWRNSGYGSGSRQRIFSREFSLRWALFFGSAKRWRSASSDGSSAEVSEWRQGRWHKLKIECQKAVQGFTGAVVVSSDVSTMGCGDRWTDGLCSVKFDDYRSVSISERRFQVRMTMEASGVAPAESTQLSGAGGPASVMAPSSMTTGNAIQVPIRSSARPRCLSLLICVPTPTWD